MLYTHKQVSDLVDLALLYGSTLGSEMTQEHANAWIALNHPEKEFADLEELKVFVPTHLLLDEVDNSENKAERFQWEEVNEQRLDWFKSDFASIAVMAQIIVPGIARVVFTNTFSVEEDCIERYDQGIYKYDIELSK